MNHRRRPFTRKREPPIVYKLAKKKPSSSARLPAVSSGTTSWRWDVDDVVSTSLHRLLAGLVVPGTWQLTAQHLAVLRRTFAELALGQNGRRQVGQWSTTLWSHTAVDAEPWVGRGGLAPDFGVTCAGLADGEEEKEDEVDDEEDGVEDGEGFDCVVLGIERAGGDCAGESQLGT